MIAFRSKYDSIFLILISISGFGLSTDIFDTCWRDILHCLSPHLDIHEAVGRTVDILRSHNMLGLLPPENMATLVQSPEKIDNVYFALRVPLDEDIFLRENLEMILQFPHQALILGFICMSRLPHAAETREVLRRYPIQITNIQCVFTALDYLHLRNFANETIILQHPLQAGNIAWILKVLAHHQLLTPANIITMLQQLEQSGHMVKIVEALEHAQEL